MLLKSQIRGISVICGLVLLFAICGICGSGCDQTSGQRIDSIRAVISQASSINSAIDASFADVSAVIASCELVLNDPNIPEDMKTQVRLALLKAKAKLDSLIIQKKKVTDILASYQLALDAVDTNNLTPQQEIAIYGQGAIALAPLLPEKARGYVYLTTLLVPVIGGLVGSIIKNVRQARKIDNDKAVLTDIVVSVDKLLKSDQVKDIEEAKFILQDNQSGLTQDTVDAIKDPFINTAPKS